MLISIIISTKNDRTLRYVIESTLHLAKAYDTELIIVEGCDTSRANTTLSEFIEKNGRIYSRTLVLRDPGNSLSFSRYLGYVNSTGDVIIFLDGDTLLHPAFHLYLEKELEDADFIASATRILKLDSATKACNMLYEVMDVLKQHLYKPTLIPQARIYRRAVLDRVGKVYVLASRYFAEDRILTALSIRAGFKYKYSQKLKLIKIDEMGFINYFKKHRRYGHGICCDTSDYGRSILKDYILLRRISYLNILTQVSTLYYMSTLLKTRSEPSLGDILNFIKFKYMVDLAMLIGDVDCLLETLFH